ncbi:septum formation initiator [Micromonospora zingiberis]|uniref:Septum formation initiator n=1 Tax=Micromonospora zingiberis TaxID=2053011 RepID=A0A4R0G3Y6_9ACTN|nr:septum formation initiator [Micromonospora zingiberis]TCB90966.1 septum formation initiator [Micromonospora zingiberis]
MGRRTFLAVAGWLATAVVAMLIGVAAIQLVGESLTGTPGGVRSQEEVARALAEPTPAAPPGAATSAPPSPSGTPPSPSAEPGSRRGFTSPGGSAVAECVPGGVYLVSWTPQQGYRVDDYDRGPDDDVEVKFVGPSGEYELSMRCVAGVPVLEPDDD